MVLGMCMWTRKWLNPNLDKRYPNEAIWKQIYNDFGDVYAKRGVGQLADALIRPDLSRQARQARQVRQRSGQRPGSQTLHLCMFQRPRAIKHYTCACPSAHGAPNTTPVHSRVLTEHQTLHLCRFEHSWSTKHYS